MALAYRILFSGSICPSVFQITEVKAEVTRLPVRGFPRGRTRQRDLLTHALQHLPLFLSAALVGVTQTDFLPGKAFWWWMKLNKLSTDHLKTVEDSFSDWYRVRHAVVPPSPGEYWPQSTAEHCAGTRSNLIVCTVISVSGGGNSLLNCKVSMFCKWEMCFLCAITLL